MPLWNKNKKGAKRSKNSSPINEPYFGMIIPGSFDKNDEPVAQLIASIDDLDQRWPSVTLSDLNKFTLGLKELSRETNTPYLIDKVKYMRLDAENKAVFTGLIWEPVTIGPDFSNYVVETIEATVNDEDTRNNDQLDYDDIILPAFTTFMDNAVELSDISENDLPTLPTAESYDTAIRTNSVIELEPRKFSEFSQTTDEVSHSEDIQIDEHIPDVQEPLPTDAVTDSQPFNFGFGSVETNDTPEPVNMTTSEPIVPENTMTEAPRAVTEPSVPVQATPAPVSRHEVVRSVNNSTSYVSNLVVQAPQFKTTDTSNPVVGPEDTSYVPSKLNDERRKANDFLNSTAKALETKIKAEVLNNAFVQEQQARFEEQTSELLNSDWQADMFTGIERGVNAKYDQQFQQAEESEKRVYDAGVAQEHQRHTANLEALEVEYQTRLTETQRSIDANRTAELYKAKESTLPAVQNKIETQLRAIQSNFENKMQRFVEEKSFTMLSEAQDLLSNLYVDFEKELQTQETGLIPIHEKAMQAATLLANSEDNMNQVTSLQKANSDLVTSRQTAETTILSLTSEIEALKKQVRTAEDLTNNYKSDADRVRGQLQEIERAGQTNETNSLLAAALVQTKPEPATKTPESSFWKVATIGLLALGLVGGSAYTIHSKDVKQSEFNAAMKKEQADLKEQLKLSQDNEKKSSEEAKKAQAEVNKTQFSDLDADLDNGSLVVYYAKYYNANLETEERTTKVGNLLIQYGDEASARELARSNGGHNAQLVAQLAGV